MGRLRKTTELSSLGHRLYALSHLSEKASRLGACIEGCVTQFLFECLLVGLKCEQGSRFRKRGTDFLEPHSPAALTASLGCH